MNPGALEPTGDPAEVLRRILWYDSHEDRLAVGVREHVDVGEYMTDELEAAVIADLEDQR